MRALVATARAHCGGQRAMAPAESNGGGRLDLGKSIIFLDITCPHPCRILALTHSSHPSTSERATH